MKTKIIGEGGGLINFLPLKRGGLLEGGGLFEGGEGNRGFTVLHFQNDYSSMPFWPFGNCPMSWPHCRFRHQ